MTDSPLSNQKRRFALDEIRGLGCFQTVEWVDETDSTNKQMAERIRQQSMVLPALLIADRQTSGVGRGNHSWWSAPGCLMFTMAIPIGPKEEANSVESALLPLRVGYAIAECLETLATSKPMVKWPNDVYLENRKVSGVLIEVIPQGPPLPMVAVIGIGINCQLVFTDAPNELRNSACSLHEFAKSGFAEQCSTESVLIHFLHHWREATERQTADPEWLLKQWSHRSLLDGQWVEIKQANESVQGRCIGIDDRGALLLQDARLRVTHVIAGTVVSYRTSF